MFRRNIHELTKADIYEAITAKVSEGERVDYKLAPYSGRDADKKEFIEDIVSFSNRAGGHIVIGVEEEAGDPVRVVGIGSMDPDAEILRMTQMIRSSIEPRLTCQMVKVACDEGPVIVIQIPKGTNPPLRSTMKESGFVTRTNNGKQHMNVADIRAMILTSNKVDQTLQRMRDERLTLLREGKGVHTLTSDRLITLHIIPIAAVDEAPVLDMGIHTQQINQSLAPPLHHERGGFGVLPNFEGASSVARPFDPTPKEAYVQLFRTGAIEAVEAYLLNMGHPEPNVLFMHYERMILELTDAYRHLLARLDVPGPYHVFVSLLNVEGYVIKPEAFSAWEAVGRYKPIAQKELLLDRVVIDDLDDDLEQKFRPIFNSVWRATGRERSESYNENGLYVGKKWQRAKE